jgi:hypothetical protein
VDGRVVSSDVVIEQVALPIGHIFTKCTVQEAVTTLCVVERL